MYSRFLTVLFINVNVFCEDLTLVHLDGLHPFKETPSYRSKKYMDIYTNHDDFKEVLNTYYGIPRRVNHRNFERVPELLDDVSVYKNLPFQEKISLVDLENSAHLDRIDFHYPHELSSDHNEELGSSFGSFTNEQDLENNKHSFMQSQKLVTDESSEEDDTYGRYKRPLFKTSKFVQKIPKSSTSGPTKYEELALNKQNATNSTKNRINHLLRRYLTKLYTKKYNDFGSNIQSSTALDQDEKSNKLFDSSTLRNLKNKAFNKINRLFSLFTVVKFNNTQCTANNSDGVYQGTCYTASRCSTEGGSAIGNCASGYGVCCVFIATCGGSGNQNCTYFQSPNYPNYYPSDGGTVIPTTTTTQNPSPTPDPRLPWNFGRSNWERQSQEGAFSCTISVSKLNDNISRIRIDFEDLELAGPTNGTCMIERLVITGQNTNNQIPDICGYNTGQHVYVDVSSLSGPLQLSVLSTTGARKRFKIRICQYADTCLEPSSNCLQYYTGVTGVISSFNYNQASMLSRSVPGYFNNLNYAICIRREEGYCSISYTNEVNRVEYPFQLTNLDNSGNMVILPGQAGADIFNCPDDYIVIDGTRLCGDKLNDGSINQDFTMNAVVTDTGAGPIVIPVRTDSSITGLGFRLFYTQNRCTNF